MRRRKVTRAVGLDVFLSSFGSWASASPITFDLRGVAFGFANAVPARDARADSATRSPNIGRSDGLDRDLATRRGARLTEKIATVVVCYGRDRYTCGDTSGCSERRGD
jgi:hypothetical protein